MEYSLINLSWGSKRCLVTLNVEFAGFSSIFLLVDESGSGNDFPENKTLEIPLSKLCLSLMIKMLNGGQYKTYTLTSLFTSGLVRSSKLDDNGLLVTLGRTFNIILFLFVLLPLQEPGVIVMLTLEVHSKLNIINIGMNPKCGFYQNFIPPEKHETIQIKECLILIHCKCNPAVGFCSPPPVVFSFQICFSFPPLPTQKMTNGPGNGRNLGHHLGL